MENVHLSYADVGVYVIVFNVLLGILFGFFPLLVGTKLRNAKYGMFGFFASIFGGALIGFFLAFPAALFFTWLIIRRSQTLGSISVDADFSGENDHTA